MKTTWSFPSPSSMFLEISSQLKSEDGADGYNAVQIGQNASPAEPTRLSKVTSPKPMPPFRHGPGTASKPTAGNYTIGETIQLEGTFAVATRLTSRVPARCGFTGVMKRYNCQLSVLTVHPSFPSWWFNRYPLTRATSQEENARTHGAAQVTAKSPYGWWIPRKTWYSSVASRTSGLKCRGWKAVKRVK